MGRIIIIVTVMFLGFIGFSQETFKTAYFVKQNRGNSLKIKMDKKVKYDELSPDEKESLVHDKFPPLGESLSYTTEQVVNGKKVQVLKTIVITEEFYKKQTNIIKPTVVQFKGTKKVSAKLEDKTGRLFLNEKSDNNIYRKTSDSKNGVYYIDLKNREYVWLPFTELTFTSLTLPLKYRFKNKGENLEEDFTSAINLNFFLGLTYGNTKFIRREKVNDKMNTWKLTGGLILGTSTVTLNANNTTLAVAPLAANESLTKGLFSLGLGATYAFNNFNLGIFYGWDYSIGENADKWNYNKEPWLGIGIGYSLFKI